MSDPPPEPPGEPAPGRRRATALAVVGSLAAVAALVATRWGADDDQVERPDRAAASTTTTTSGPGIVDPPAADGGRSALGGIRFTDVTEAAGLAVPHSEGGLSPELSMTSGVAVADVEGDGDLDLYLTRLDRPSSLYLNDGTGRFTDVTERAGVAGPAAGAGAASFGDVDGDGCVDLVVSGAGAGEVHLYVARCDGTFAEEAAARGVTLPLTTASLGAQGHGATFGDPDHDGDLDLLLLHWDPAIFGGFAGRQGYEATLDATSVCDRLAAIRAAGAAMPGGVPDRPPVAGPNRSRYLRNDGTGRFTDATAEMGLVLDQVSAFTADFVDVDGDGWEDLLVAGDFCTSRLYRNDGGRRFVDVTGEAGVATDENAMGSVVTDVDEDGDPDWFLTSIYGGDGLGQCPAPNQLSGCSGNRLFLNRGDGTFTDGTDDAGVRAGGWGWGAVIEDFGDDGRRSIAMTNGYLGDGAPWDRYRDDPMRLWVPTDDGGRRVEAAEAAGLTDRGIGHGLVAFDADGDGDLDLLVANYADPPVLYRNDRPTDRRSITVRLRDTTRPGNREGLGSRVRVVRGDGSAVTGWISTGGSYETRRPAELHVGLGRRGSVERIEVWWPGATDPQVLEDPGVGVVVVERG